MAIVGYEYRMKLDAVSDWDAPVDLGEQLDLSEVIGSLAAATTYDFQVRGYDAEGAYTDWSNIATASTLGLAGFVGYCSFECGPVSGSPNVHWETGAAGLTSPSTVVQSQDKALRVLNSGGVQQYIGFKPSDANLAPYFVVRFYIRFAVLPDGDTYLASVDTIGFSALGLFFNQSDGKLYAAKGKPVGSATLAASGVSVGTGQWYRIDMIFDRTSGARSLELQVDGVTSGPIGSAAAGSGGQFHLGCELVEADIYFDSFYMSDAASDYPIGDMEFTE